MDINRAALDSLFTGFNTKFQEGYTMPGLELPSFAMTIPSSTSMETYGWLLLLSRMRKWLGDRQVQNVENKTMTLTNDDYEHTIGVKANDIEDDKLGIYSPLFQKMGADAAYLWRRLAVDALVANGNWLDGSAFFYDSRKYGANTIDNYATAALTSTTFESVYLAMQSYLDHAGNPLGVTPNLLIVGPKNRTAAWNIVKNEWVATGTTNTTTTIRNANFGATDLLILPELVGTYDDYWFLADTRSVVKPLAVQQRKIGALQRWDKETDECVKNANRYDYGVHYRGAACLTLPHLIYGNFVA